MTALVSRPRRTEAFGVVRAGIVYVNELYQRFFDDVPTIEESPEIIDFAGAGPHFITAEHAGKVVRVTHGVACTLRLPRTSTESVDTPFMCGVVQGGAGQLTVDTEGADTIESANSNKKLATQHSTAVIQKRQAGSPNIWLLSGDLTA